MRPALLLTCFLVFIGSPFLRGKDEAKRTGTCIVSGFAPFGGRDTNGSFVLARSVAAAHPSVFTAVEVPVVWGAPLEAWKKHGETTPFWLAFGEGTPVFQIEVLARNARGPHSDNNQSLPSQPLILEGSPDTMESPLPAEEMAGSLRSKGFPVRVSRNAGQYLCEEMLYTLLASRKEAPGTVLFVHIPLLGRKVKLPDGTEREVTEAWLDEVGRALIAELQARKLLPVSAR